MQRCSPQRCIGSVFARLLDRYSAGVSDERTLLLLREQGEMIPEHHA